ncbi:MAG TPA: tetratricopeptide repeat protein [Pseudoneobacillus sp.]|nr:tetratricopeptide repeat protein [Pseudoneobacillus sp.]
MKKRKSSKPHKDNIFLFPNVDKLLMEKGLDSLQNKKFDEAIEFLSKAQELDHENEEVGLGLTIAYFESGNLLAAKKLTQNNLQKGLGDYFQLMDLYIMILLQLNEYEEIVSTIQALLDEREIPGEKLDNFIKILEFSKRKLESDRNRTIDSSIEENKEFDLFQYESLNDQFFAVAKLSDKNVRAYLHGMKEYLTSSQGHPFIKTMLLQLLKEQEIHEEIRIEKFSQKKTVVPAQLVHFEEFESTIQIKEFLKSSIEQKNPILFENINSIVDRHSFLLFPLDRKPSDPFIWAAAYHFIALEYFGETVSLGEIAEKYKILESSLIHVMAFIRELEEISSPIL